MNSGRLSGRVIGCDVDDPASCASLVDLAIETFGMVKE